MIMIKGKTMLQAGIDIEYIDSITTFLKQILKSIISLYIDI